MGRKEIKTKGNKVEYYRGTPSGEGGNQLNLPKNRM
jgi:hypothetical protein